MLGGIGFVLWFFLLVLPVLFLIVRRKWRLAVARSEEINRLLVLAAEEAARAELEASIRYGYDHPVVSASPVKVPVPVSKPGFGQRVCAVCFEFAPNRCARCKSVNYCSGKCQITHWRQGHKDECRPLPVSSHNHDEAFEGNALRPSCSDSVTNDELPYNIQGENGIRISDPAVSSPGVFLKDDSAAAKSSVHVEEVDSLTKRHEPSEPSVSHASFVGHGASVNDSAADDVSSDNFNSELRNSSSTVQSYQTASSDEHLEQTKPLEEEVRVRVDSDVIDSASGGRKFRALRRASKSSTPNAIRSDKNAAEPSVSTSGFWDGTLDSGRTRNHVPGIKTLPKTVAAVNRKLFDESALLHSSSIRGSIPSGSNSLVLETSDDNHGCLLTTKLVVESTSPVKKSAAARNCQSTTYLSSLGPYTSIKGTNRQLKSGEGVADSSKDRGLPLRGLERENDPKRSNKDSQQSLTLQKGDIRPRQSNDPSSTGMNGQTAVALKSRRAGSMPDASVGVKSELRVVDQLRPSKLTKKAVGKNSEKAVFPYDIFVKLYHWNKVELRPCGLINCGNSCYANVVLQCLAFTPPLTAYLLQGMHSNSCASKDWCFTCEFERLILKANEVGNPQSPVGILSHIQKIGSHLTNGRQEDAHEFLRYAIETMQYICLQEAEVNASGSLKEETTLVGLTFGGYLRSKIKCTSCHGKSERQERMMDLTVEIEGDIETLEEALQKFTATESLDGENKYSCGRCKSYEKAKKKLSISEAPNILTIALKRFQSGKFGKLNKTIRFPEILNLAPYMRGGSDKSPIYRLYGVVVHLDIMNASFSGHYVCYVRNAQNKWYKIDDSMVKPIELERVLNMGAYMLFYARCSPRAPKSIRNTLVSRDFSRKINAPEADISRSSGSGTSRQRESAANGNHVPDGYHQQDESSVRFVQNILDGDSSSDSSFNFTQSDEVSTSTDSTWESFSADDLSPYMFVHDAFFPHSSDSDTSSSSSSSPSSSPQYMKRSPLSNSERYASGPSVLNV